MIIITRVAATLMILMFSVAGLAQKRTIQPLGVVDWQDPVITRGTCTTTNIGGVAIEGYAFLISQTTIQIGTVSFTGTEDAFPDYVGLVPEDDYVGDAETEFIWQADGDTRYAGGRVSGLGSFQSSDGDMLGIRVNPDRTVDYLVNGVWFAQDPRLATIGVYYRMMVLSVGGPGYLKSTTIHK